MLSQAGSALFIKGTGLSAASGIPTYYSPSLHQLPSRRGACACQSVRHFAAPNLRSPTSNLDQAGGSGLQELKPFGVPRAHVALRVLVWPLVLR